MVDLTLVTCLAPCLSAGRSFEDAARHLAPLLEAGVPLVVYVEDGWREPLLASRPGDWVRLHDTSPARRWAGLGPRAELEAAWAAHAAPGRPSLDGLMAGLTRMGMLHDQSIWNPFGTRYLAWVDADVAASVHPRYLTSERLLEALPCLLRRFLFLVRPGAVADAAGTPAAARVQGQLFGGELGEIAAVNALYYQQLDLCLRSDALPTDEAIFTRMLAGDPGRFDRFVLQDNGLLGFLFEAMRAGRVPLERTTIY